MKQLSLFSPINDCLEKNEAGKKTSTHRWRLFVDGASRNNPGPSGAGIVLYKDDVLFYKHGFYLGVKTNNQAEYLAVILGLFILQENMENQDTVTVVSDSQLLVRQLQGVYRVKNLYLQPLYMCAKNIISQHRTLLMHVLREDNILADQMANEGVDFKNNVPKKYMDLLANNNIHI